MARCVVSPDRSARLLEAVSEQLERSKRCRFIVEATAGSIASEDYAAYLAIEENFVRTAARVSGFSLWRADDWTLALEHAHAIAELVGEQSDYFAATRPRWSAPSHRLEDAVVRSNVLSDYVLGLVEQEHGYWAAATGMFAAETLYSQWCSEAVQQNVTRSADLAAWIELHATEEFARQAARLGALVDRIPPAVPDDQVIDWFIGMLDAEDAFHNSIYIGSTP
jgi:thiaminase/transcriptional activator TenA